MEMLTTLIKAEGGMGGQQFTPVCVCFIATSQQFAQKLA